MAAALVWGLHWPLFDNALKKLSVVSVLLLTAIPIVLAAPLVHRTLSDFRTLSELAREAKATILALSLTSLCASVLLFVSIDNKNTTLAGLTEISYPVFVALFASHPTKHCPARNSVASPPAGGWPGYLPKSAYPFELL